ncbi:MAG: type II secretion system protein GspC [Gammaproteobacteria bacterium]|nr:type II secretion system protein GspC [Gammaproteobacteria bacterium]
MQSSTPTSMAAFTNSLIQFVTHISISPQLITKLPMLVNVLIVTLLAIEFANLTWTLFPDKTITTSLEPIKPRIAPKTRPTASLANIPALHLLGIAEKDTGNKLSKGPINAPDTQLRLELHGVFSAEKPDRSLAIIASTDGKDNTYIIGDSVPGGALLHEVYKDRVILSRNGTLEALRLKLPQADIKISKMSSTARTNAKIHSSERIKQLKESYKTNPQNLWKQVRISPVMKNGAIEGYNFSHNDNMLMKDLGIQPSDLVTAINGVQVNDNTAIFGMMQGIANMSQLELTVRRNNATETIHINFD